MAFSNISNAWVDWFLNHRPGTASGGQPGTCLVSDLAVDDYLPGQRARVSATGSTTSGVRTLTLERREVTYNVAWVAASSIIAIRP